MGVNSLPVAWLALMKWLAIWWELYIANRFSKSTVFIVNRQMITYIIETVFYRYLTGFFTFRSIFFSGLLNRVSSHGQHAVIKKSCPGNAGQLSVYGHSQWLNSRDSASAAD
jgi:hypothetical protein